MSDQQIVLTGGENAANAVVWDPNSGAALPAYLSETQEELGSNIPDRNTVPSLSYEGKMWTIVKDGNKTKLQVQNADGDTVPVPIMRMVILNFNADRGRAYYPGAYNPAASAAPTCWSADGVAPDASVKEKQAALCNGCPMSVKGSKVDTNGKELVACASHRMLAIAPAFDLTGDPLRLKIAVTSDYDKEVVEHGWFAFRQYVDFLKSRGVTNTALVVTKVKFDPTPAYPKLLFAIDRVLTQQEVADVKEALKNPKVAELLAEKWTAAGSAGTDKTDSDIKPHGLEGAYLDGWQAHPQAPGYSYRGQEVKTNEEVAALYPAPAAPPVPSPAPPQPTAPVETPAPVSQSAAPPETAAPGPTKPTDPAHIAHAGTEHEMWWIDGAWVGVKDLQARNAAAPVVEAGAPPAPEVVPAITTPAHDPRAAALADGWVQHPQSEPHGYKGQEVLEWAAIDAKYPAPAGNAASTPSDAAPAVPSGSAASASPTDEAIPDDVKNLLNKWTG